MNISDEIKDIIIIHTGAEFDGITDTSEISADLGASEFSCVQIMIDIEKKFGISIPDEDISDLTTVGALIGYVKRRIDEGEK